MFRWAQTKCPPRRGGPIVPENFATLRSVNSRKHERSATPRHPRAGYPVSRDNFAKIRFCRATWKIYHGLIGRIVRRIRRGGTRHGSRSPRSVRPQKMPQLSRDTRGCGVPLGGERCDGSALSQQRKREPDSHAHPEPIIVSDYPRSRMTISRTGPWSNSSESWESLVIWGGSARSQTSVGIVENSYMEKLIPHQVRTTRRLGPGIGTEGLARLLL